ncbi:MAG: septal ring lytic transglycosylase RlpA family protein [Leptolyngbya foveolarum]|uniref:Probable endolytic peptidoglycan transglycosylase RlpA n=1 Tax=Leptolyngbya foveolarum TaxID=47253 RepID=A0A2W4VUC8_9CYAN|nr:MAG: septal ring lytic transglycosylase RlpA family protein [Leptolyngbya foveolarum]
MSVLFNGSNKYSFASSLVAALLLSGAGITLTGASAIDSVEAKGKEALIADASSQAKPTQLIDALASNGSEGTSTTHPLSAEQSEDILVLPHAIDGRQAATLYVKDIPVLTFIGTEVDSLSNASNGVAIASISPTASLEAQATTPGDILNAEAEGDPVLRATALGKQLNLEAADAESISVRWTEETAGFTVTIGDQDLIALDSRTILADTTHDAATDAIQVTNRLRRLLGGAAPISEIQGMPEPEPVVEAAPVQQLAIASTTVGSASWYGPGFDGRLSASGEVFNQYALTAAHRTLPFGTRVLVTNVNTGQQVTVRINDRGPFSGNRIIDLSAGAAEQIGLVSAGVGTVQLDVLY